ncbi:mRNA export factor rsm1 [Neolecta irregularis DAH-3]|uniref:mRNA export factor rsm1 n=1 Tax=Neolecta irregularis (strain DAH-3) TaxID=1198029 RepID=A0A1U7LWN5_NEOID|nr:mRNA export factor rsm1 [Neolecta irregularis DAH-3]|eukprot:OLL26921.1 mRNA export factor rsm1 [Neolecta irregularis DAH-3]
MSTSLKRRVSAALSQLDSPLPPSRKRKSEEGTYVPWSQKHFLSRLGSYKPDQWTFKSPVINEVFWAKRGWACIGKDHLQCVTCSNTVTILYEEKLGPNMWADKAVSEHSESCPWHKILAIRFSDSEQVKQDFEQRYNQLIDESSIDTVHPELPSLSVSHPVEIASTLALFGWNKEGDVLYCGICQRRLGLWRYRDCKETLNVTKEHKAYCPWVYGDDRKGWEILLHILTGKKNRESDALFDLSTDDRLKRIRKLLN